MQELACILWTAEHRTGRGTRYHTFAPQQAYEAQFRNPQSPSNPDSFGLAARGIRVRTLEGGVAPGDSGGPLFIVTQAGLAEDVRVQPELRVRYVYDALNSIPTTTAMLTGIPDLPFMAEGVNIGHSAAVLGAGMTYPRARPLLSSSTSKLSYDAMRQHRRSWGGARHVVG